MNTKIFDKKVVSEMWTNKDYGESQTDTTHYRPNVSNWNDTVGAENVVGCYDENEEMGKLRATLSKPSLDMAEKDNIAKNLSKEMKGEINAELKAQIEKNKESIENVTENNTETSKTE